MNNTYHPSLYWFASWPLRGSLAVVLGLLLLAPASHASNAGNEITDVDVSRLSGNRLEIRFELAQPAEEPRSFTIQDPARVALDFAGTSNATGERNIEIDSGIARSIDLAQAGDQTRAILNLSELPPFDTRIDGNTVVVTLGRGDGDGAVTEGESDADTGADAEPETAAAAESGTDADDPSTYSSTATASDTDSDAMPSEEEAAAAQADDEEVEELADEAAEKKPFEGDAEDAPAPEQRSLDNVDFRRGRDGEAQILIDLSDPNIPVSIDRESGNIVVNLAETKVPDELRERLDVLDFATPAQFIEIMERDGDGRIVIEPRDDEFEQIAYQSDERITVELNPLTPTEVAEREEEEPEYDGEPLSLNFQDVEVRSVLQLLADFTGLNIVVSDSVSGNLTLRLREVPWDQALDIILRTQGLDKRRDGNVVYIAPFDEIAEREARERESEQQAEQQAPLRTEYIQVNYARAGDLASLLQSGDSEQQLISDRGNVSIDDRTNTLIIQDTQSNLEEARRMINRLDIPVRQVLIESRIVVATDDFNRELGARFGVSRDTTSGGTNDGFNTSGNLEGAAELRDGNEPSSDNRFNVNLPANNPSGTLGLALARLPFGSLLELELSAMQAEGQGEVISSPRVITANQSEARIEQGVEIPFQEAAASGATSTSFREATLSLTVTPQITPDDRINMDLEVTRDEVGQIFNGVPSIDTRAVTTQVLVDDGETVVLGGIYEQETNEQVERVPFFGDLPVVGRLFRNEISEDNQSELLVFVTPQIVRGIDDM